MEENPDLYGLNPKHKNTPLMVRDAIIRCFQSAHKELFLETGESKNEEEEKKWASINSTLFIKRLMEQRNADFNNPTKQDLKNLVLDLKRFAQNFRDQKTIEDHVVEMNKLIDGMQ